MKTLLVTMDFPPLLGGIANYYFNRVNKMNADEIIVLTNNPANYNFKVYNKKFFTRLIWPHWIPLIWHIFKITKKEKNQRVWVGQILPVGTAVWIVCKILKLQYFITCHGNDLLRAKSHPRKFRLAKKILNKAKFIEANTKFTKNILVQDFDVQEEKIKVVYPVCTLKKEMIDNNKVNKLKNKYNLSGKKILLTVGRLVESKGINQVLRALPQVWQKIPNLVYLVVGDGDFSKQLLVISNQVCKEKNKIIFTGSVPHSELPNYYALADTFIMTPRKNKIGDTESFGIVYLEAKEFGLPIIAGDTGGAREISNNFIFVDSKNINQIANEIKKALFSEGPI